MGHIFHEMLIILLGFRADSGMGEVTTEHLSKLGYHVFAGVFLESSFDKYADIPNVTPISLDVTSDESVENGRGPLLCQSHSKWLHTARLVNTPPQTQAPTHLQIQTLTALSHTHTTHTEALIVEHKISHSSLTNL